MRFIRPKGILAGYWVDDVYVNVPEIRQFGEHWTPEGWHVGPHHHGAWELYFQAAGSSVWRLPDGPYTVRQGEGYLVGPWIEHASVRFSRGSQHFYFIELDLAVWWTEPRTLEALPPFQILPHAHGLEPLFRLLIQEGARGGKRQPIALRHLAGLLSLHTERLLDTSRNRGERIDLQDVAPGILHAREMMEANPGHPWRLDELGRLAGLSPNYLSSRFRKVFGTPPLQYLRELRIERARHLLRDTNLSLSAVAHELGYASSQHFSTRFKQASGQSPAAFRKGQGLPLSRDLLPL